MEVDEAVKMAAPRPSAPAGSSRRSTQTYPETEPDEIIGEFRRGKEIGKGSFAAVYLAQHRVCVFRVLAVWRGDARTPPAERLIHTAMTFAKILANTPHRRESPTLL